MLIRRLIIFAILFSAILLTWYQFSNPERTHTQVFLDLFNGNIIKWIKQ